ncbi:DUF4260 domain-containing protein [Pseudonocardia alni]|uniref:DUF4260 domain-containing protein n=1 Tax=Pseudonocardia alni TaxID=33907 RepID=UPI003674A580
MRVAWAALAAFVTAFAVFETVKHGGATIPLGLLGIGLPFAAGLPLPATVRHLVGHPVPPVLVLVGATLLTGSQEQAAPPFTLGLTWLATVAVLRVLRPATGPSRT